QEEAEIYEVLAKIRGTLRRLEALSFHSEDRQAHFSGVQCCSESPAIGFRGRKDADRRQAAEARPPKVAALDERNKRLGRRAVLLPILLVDRPDAAEVKGKRWIPIMQALRLRDPRIPRRQVAVRRRVIERHHL